MSRQRTALNKDTSATAQQKSSGGVTFSTVANERVSQLEMRAENSPRMANQRKIAAAIDASPYMTAQRRMMSAIDNSVIHSVQRRVVVAGSNAADNSSQTIQCAFKGVPLTANNPVSASYTGHGFTTGGARSNTGCGVSNSIRTAGEQKNSGKSNPGTPTDMADYQQNFSRTGGLVRDPALNQASTRIHLVNHHLENSGNTQGVASNILLGSKNANKPTHLHDDRWPHHNLDTGRSVRRTLEHHVLAQASLARI